MKKLEKIERRIELGSKHGRLDSIFTIGVTFAVSSLTVILVQRENIPQILWVIFFAGFFMMTGVNIYTKKMKREKK